MSIDRWMDIDVEMEYHVSRSIVFNTLHSHGSSVHWILQEKAMAPYSSTLAWKIPWTEEPGRLQSMGSLELDTTERLHFHFSLSCIAEGNWQPTPVFLPGESQGWEAWWAAVYGVAQSWTCLKQQQARILEWVATSFSNTRIGISHKKNEIMLL